MLPISIGYWPLELDTGNNGNISAACPPPARSSPSGHAASEIWSLSSHYRRSERLVHLRDIADEVERLGLRDLAVEHRRDVALRRERAADDLVFRRRLGDGAHLRNSPAPSTHYHAICSAMRFHTHRNLIFSLPSAFPCGIIPPCSGNQAFQGRRCRSWRWCGRGPCGWRL